MLGVATKSKDKLGDKPADQPSKAKAEEHTSRDQGAEPGAATTTTKLWYAVHTRPKSERVAKVELGREMEAYLPMQTVTRRWSDRYKKIEQPLIPNYVFVLMEEPQKILVYYNPFVLRILSKNGRIAPIPSEEMSLVRQIEASRMPWKFEGGRLRFTPGDHVLFRTGPLAGIEGWVLRNLNESKVYVKVPSFDSYFTVAVEELAVHYRQLFEGK